VVAHPTAKASTLLSTAAFIAERMGEEVLARVLAAAPADVRDLLGRVGPTDEVSFDDVRRLWRAADAVLAAQDPQWVERSGEFSIESTGLQLYGGILRKATPLAFLTQHVSLFRLYYHPGNMEPVESEDARAVLRLDGFDHGEPLFCRRQTGGLRCAITLAGGQDAHVEHVRCTLEGDAFCEWELRWS